MRFGGEWKCAGGGVEPCDNKDTMATAVREFEEEFLTPVPSTGSVIRKFGKRHIGPVKNRTYTVHQYVVIADERGNEWLRDIDIDGINRRLENKRRSFAASVSDGSYFNMPDEERMAISPEVHTVAWLPLAQGVHHAFTSMNRPCATGMASSPPDCWLDQLEPVNDFQASEFKRIGVWKRDELLDQLATFLRLDSCVTVPDIVALAEKFKQCESSGDM